MATSGTHRLRLLAGVFSAAAASLTCLAPVTVQAQTVSPDAGQNQSDQGERPLATSILSPEGGKRLMQEAASAVSSQNYDLAVSKLQEARQVFNQLSNFYQQLAKSFEGIDPRIADQQRQDAVQTAQMRDEATYQLALVHRAQNKPELAVPLLIQIIQSQNPTRELGQKAYQQLFELGFVNSPYPRRQDAGSAGGGSNTPAPNR